MVGSGELDMQDVVEADVVQHHRRDFLHFGDISQSFKLCCTCFQYFCGTVGSESKGEMVWRCGPTVGGRTFNGAMTFVKICQN
jgi:hypothetical protein